jgi:outer membrane protein TolC
MKRTMCLALVITLTAASLWAETDRRLLLAECVQRALSGSRSLQSSAFNRDAARIAVDEAWMLFMPSLTLIGGYSRVKLSDPFLINRLPPDPPLNLSPSIEDNWLLRVELKQNVFTGFKIKSAIEAARAAADVQDAAYSTERENIVYLAGVAYRELGKAIEADKIALDMLETVRSRVNEVKKLRAQGLATANDELKADSELSAAEMQKIDAGSAVRLARARLNLLIGLPLETPLVTEPFTPPNEAAALSLDTALAAALARRPELAQAQGLVKAGEAGIESAASAFYPALILKGNFTYANPNPNVFPRSAEWKDTWEIGAAVSVDLGAYPQAVFKVEQAERRLEYAQSRYGEVRDAISLEVLAAYLDVGRYTDRLAVAVKLLAQAEENYRVTMDKNRQGLAVTSDVLDARLAFLKAKLVQMQAGYDCEIARLAFLRRQGLSWQSSTP